MSSGSKKSSKDALLEALKYHPDSAAEQLAGYAGVGRSTANRVLADLESTARAVRAAGGRDGGRKLPDRWRLATDVALTREGKPRLRRGQLAELVTEYLSARPDDQYSPTSVAKAVGHSAGAIYNALERLVAGGTVRRISDKPCRYSIKR